MASSTNGCSSRPVPCSVSRPGRPSGANGSSRTRSMGIGCVRSNPCCVSAPRLRHARAKLPLRAQGPPHSLGATVAWSSRVSRACCSPLRRAPRWRTVRAGSAWASRSMWMPCDGGWSSSDSTTPARSNCRGSSPSAAALSMSLLPTGNNRYAWSCGATRSSPCGNSTWRRSAARSRSRRSKSRCSKRALRPGGI